MKVWIDQDLCTGDGLCEEIAPDVFTLLDDGLAYVKDGDVFFADIMDEDDAFFDKAIEGLVLFAFNQGEVCTCPSRAIIQASIYDKFYGTCDDARKSH